MSESQLCEGHSSSKHTGVRGLFSRHSVRTGRVPADLGHLYKALFDSRQDADYKDLATFQAPEVRGWLDRATAFLAEIARLAEGRLRDEPRLS